MWIILSILTAFFYAAQGTWSKKVTKTVTIYTTTWAMFTFAIPLLIIPLLLTGIPMIKLSFLWSSLSSIIINMVAVTLFVKALKISPLNMTYPFLAFTPVFLIFTGYIFLGEVPDTRGLIGIILITIGAYVLNIDKIKDGFSGPINAIKEEKGAVLMLIVALLWSFAAALDKVAVLASSPYFYMLAFNTGFFILYLPFLFKIKPDFINEVKTNFFKLFFLGILGSLLFLTQMTALKIALVSYVIAIKRTGMVFSLIFGCMFFKENLSISKITGTFLMISGIFFITV